MIFTKNRESLLEGDVAARFMAAVLSQPEVMTLLSDEHFAVDGTLIEASASMKSFKPKDESGGAPPAGGRGRNAARDFHGKQRANASHASTNDPDARLFRKGRGKEAKLCHMGHLLLGEPPRPDRRCHGDRGLRHRRARRCRGHAGPPDAPAPWRMTAEGIATRPGLARSTVAAELARLGLNRSSALAPKDPVRRYERARPGDLIHLDTKKLARLDKPDHRGSWRRHRSRGRYLLMWMRCQKSVGSTPQRWYVMPTQPNLSRELLRGDVLC